MWCGTWRVAADHVIGRLSLLWQNLHQLIWHCKSSLLEETSYWSVVQILKLKFVKILRLNFAQVQVQESRQDGVRGYCRWSFQREVVFFVCGGVPKKCFFFHDICHYFNSIAKQITPKKTHRCARLTGLTGLTGLLTWTLDLDLGLGLTRTWTWIVTKCENFWDCVQTLHI